jgi:hypothetical protein
LSLHEALGLVGPFAGFAAVGLAFPGPSVLDVDDGEPQELDGVVVGREVAACLGDLPQPGVDGLDGYLELSRQPGL